ncbi:MAG: family 16 glycosylhydrolase [Cryomorphaceae bacterium]
MMHRSLFILFVLLLPAQLVAQEEFDVLVWSDECDGSGAIDTEKWHHQTQLPNGSSWYNNEIQHYTNREENAYLEDGAMYIMAQKETFTDQGVTKEYTSARLNSKFAFTYGRVEVRAKLPIGVGTWPAIWMLGKNINEPGGYWQPDFGNVGWPACGEVDIMEHWGTNQNYVSSAMHTPSSYGGTVNVGGTTLNDVSNTFHVYALEWTEEKMEFSADGTVYYTYDPAVKDASTWPFDADQYMLLNVAILPNIAANFTESPMVIDYVRIYQSSPTGYRESNPDQGVRLYPNPSQEKPTLRVPTEYIGGSVNLRTMDGRTVHSSSLNSAMEVVDTSSLSPGMYLVDVRSLDGATMALRMMVQ